jgi:hypothetical protein
VPLEYIIGAKIFPFNAEIHCSNYKWQLHIAATKQAIYVRSIKGNYIPVAYMRLKLISGRYLGLTFTDT